jgi:hypothetical protein
VFFELCLYINEIIGNETAPDTAPAKIQFEISLIVSELERALSLNTIIINGEKIRIPIKAPKNIDKQINILKEIS